MTEDVRKVQGTKGPDDLVTCLVCDDYLRKEDGFTCPKCRRGPLCKKHKAPDRRECVSCVFEMKAGELAELKKQEQSIRGFLSLMQFLFIMCAILFVTTETGLADMVEFLKFSFITENVKYMGILSVSGYLLFYAILYNQKRKISEMESQMSKTEFRRRIR
jgi:hypothetical protein